MSLVLIAEDEDAMLDIFAQIIEDMGHRTLRAHNGEEALLLARTQTPDLVVSDHMMPRRTGMDLLRAIRADTGLREVPFLLLSAARPQGLEEADAFLGKPVDLETFESAVRRVMRVRPPEAVAPEASLAAMSPGGTMREEMLNWVAHEIKTPLSAARLNAQVLLRKQTAQPDDADAKYAEAILRQLDRMDSLVTSILDAARLSDGKMVLHQEPGDFASFLHAVVQEWRELQPQVDFSLEGTEQPLPLIFDPERVRNILNNLLSNAVKYGGERRRVEVGLSLSPGLAVVHVRDWGQGMAASEIPNIFGRFHRAPGSGGNGHGLGLYIASALARLHGGSLSAKSNLGEGSTFSLRLPRVG
ncbi:ATP-binding response regulator [Stigmatella aurantiaca]|uniref:histidine kinase n=1 Tax=Stigmatella aurantiaca (strain DW4/3-1) TaxID=378806 RepID=Q08XC0_STIAD|nr:hybrid sensor histidine kinase/response regulator [Stigmatella aurantiaca]ADO72324.1 Sensor protein [Stigmatella aurantiaca DW4/3-1]EAU65134.1 response regulator/sensor histidine kinase, putative [Stigmatella aurantiaca DW4/3-1]